jgi:hypothetical protein
MTRLFRNLVIIGAVATALWPVSHASGQTVTCVNGAAPSAAGICPIFVPGDPSCSDVIDICGITRTSPNDEVFLSPPRSGVHRKGAFEIQVDVIGSSLRVRDVSPTSQQNGTRGYEVAIVRRNGAYVYCGTSVLDDVVRGPGSGTPTQLSVCWAKGPCGIDETRVANACTQYNPAGGVRTSDFIQSYEIGPLEQDVNVCGCPRQPPEPPTLSQFCDARQPIFSDFEKQLPRFVACNPDGSPLKSAEAESIVTEGTNSCIWMTIGGRRVLVDQYGNDPRC